jgi:hypothetical protein
LTRCPSGWRVFFRLGIIDPMQDEPNGILPYILGEVIGRTSREALPIPGPDQPPDRTVEVDAGPPHHLVRIRYRLMRNRHGKSQNWFWTAVYAERVDG